MTTEIRKLSSSEAFEYRKIRLECLKNFPGNFGSYFEEENIKPQLLFENYIEEENPDHFMTGAFYEGKLIGICGFQRQDRIKTKHRGEIVHMYVHPEFTGKKIGSDLLNTTIKTAFLNSEIEQITLSYVEGNSSAEKLYQQCGFKEYGRLQNYFKTEKGYNSQRFMLLERQFRM